MNWAVQYVSTRGDSQILSFDEVLLAGMAPDGGLYVPAQWPKMSGDEIRSLRGRPYHEVATHIMRPFVGGRVSDGRLAAIVREAYAPFRHPAVAPLTQIGNDRFILELFHGPTLAFKDVAMQVLGRLFDEVLSRRKSRITIVGATSGDTGSAALEACRDRSAIDIFILYPHGRPSDIQRRQMTTVKAPNTQAIAVDGTFDDCQDIVKALFADETFREQHRLSAVNSINWARVMAQVVYYFTAALALGAPDRPVSFCVPTGNFGNVYAGYVAQRMGLPIERLVIGTNRNDIVHQFFSKGRMHIGSVAATPSPSMDIQVPSNLERLLFTLFDRDGTRLKQALLNFREQCELGIHPSQLERARSLFDSAAIDDETTLATIAETHQATGLLIDPHTAVGVAAATERSAGLASPMVILGCAHPAKFPADVERASALVPTLPANMAGLLTAEEQFQHLPADYGAISGHIARTIAERQR